ncbi:probable 20S rRNA accumulation protein 4 [Punica granatum]|uniref:Programmed cell death protein 2 C-terminal domain-containing protein n=2 Tax=Punica granatum TaxID=22663 RepID=A0A218VZG5_PUNGR|nr:probable 20S rRNA accumulation protein 4 [Punica granatum]OWM65598.1 hypothetical protein CDL15_Pgr017095 [Punica granatum]PKI33435.1 hypothetical protein CRG98_046166 [Punica granatum]
MGGVILGMPGSWAKVFREASDHYTTKIGGLPDWPFPREALELSLLECRVCGSKLSLVAQVYAPIANGALMLEERVLYILGCLVPTCGKTPLSWRALRVQKSCSREDKSDAARGTAVPDSEPSGSVRGKNWWEDFDEDDDDEDVDLKQLGRALSEATIAASNHKKQNGHCDSSTAKRSSTSNSSLRGNDSDATVVPCFYIYSQEETSKAVASISLNCSSLSIMEERSSKDDDSAREEAWEEERYEYDKALTADRTYLKFKKRLDANPEQCFRYSYGGKPLLAEKADLKNPGSCGLCGCLRHFEMQLMPPLLYFVQEEADGRLKDGLENWNWMTLMIYTCSQNCHVSQSKDSRREGWIIAEETVQVQYERAMSEPAQLGYFS